MSRGPCRFTWIDAYIPDDVWYYKDEFVYEHRVIETVGWCIHQDRDYYAVAGTYDPETNGYCGVILIPRGCVRSVKELDRLPDDSDLAEPGVDLASSGHP